MKTFDNLFSNNLRAHKKDPVINSSVVSIGKYSKPGERHCSKLYSIYHSI
jgi:hypothetical protein